MIKWVQKYQWWPSEKVQQVKVFAIKYDNKSLIPGAYTVG